MYRSSGAERLYIKNACRSAALCVLWTQIAKEFYARFFQMDGRVVGDRYPTFLPAFVHGDCVGMHQISSIRRIKESFMIHYKPRSFCKIVKDVWYHIVESDDASGWILRRRSTAPIKDHGVRTGNFPEKEFYTTLSQVCAACPNLGTPHAIYLEMESGRT